MPGDTLFLEVDAKGDEVDPLSATPWHEKPAWNQCWKKAIVKALAKQLGQPGMSMKDAIAASSDAYPVKVKKVKHVVPSDDTRRLRELQGAQP